MSYSESLIRLSCIHHSTVPHNYSGAVFDGSRDAEVDSAFCSHFEGNWCVCCCGVDLDTNEYEIVMCVSAISDPSDRLPHIGGSKRSLGKHWCALQSVLKYLVEVATPIAVSKVTRARSLWMPSALRLVSLDSGLWLCASHELCCSTSHASLELRSPTCDQFEALSGAFCSLP